MEFKEFKIEGRDETFRIGKVSPVELLSFGKTDMSSLNNKNPNADMLKQQNILITFALEHIEVKVGNTWVAVKSKDTEVYFPIGIEKDLKALLALDSKFEQEVYCSFFPKSEE